MKLLLFSDLHCDLAAARQLVAQSQDVDVVIGAGDFASVHQGLDRTLNALRDIHCPTILVPGNNETLDALREACQGWAKAHVLHGTGCTIDGVPFFGIGGGIPVTPFGSWSFDFTEDQARALLADCPSDCVLISHSPPQGAVDRDSRGRHLGSVAVRSVIESKQPRLVVCGHIHASGGQQETILDTAVVNAGPSGVLWTLEGHDRSGPNKEEGR